jgi:hypothetical protein
LAGYCIFLEVWDNSGYRNYPTVKMSEDKGGFFNLDLSKFIESLKSVDTPIKLAGLATISALVVLIFAFIKVQSGVLQTSLIVLMSGAIALSPIVTIVLESKKVGQPPQQPVHPPLNSAQSSATTSNSIPFTYGAFISAPMDTLVSDREWEEHRRRTQNLISALQQNCAMNRVFYAGELYPNRGGWQTSDFALRQNFQALMASDKFIMIYPRKASSSTLVEIGMALAFKKDIVIFAKNPDDLPFLLRRAANASNYDGLPHIGIYSYQNFDDLINIVRSDGSSLFLTDRPRS